MVTPDYFRYWGKARPATPSGDRYHLLAYHSLDVAACARELIRLPQYSMKRLADSLGWPAEVAEQLFVYFMALHDIGKFSPTFQNLAQDLSPQLVPRRPVRASQRHRHDTLGQVLWEQGLIAPNSCLPLPSPDHDCWGVWARAVTGHHGEPPQELEKGGNFPILCIQHFLKEDIAAARNLAAKLAELLLPTSIPIPDDGQMGVLKGHSWILAGIAVLADWIGSDQRHFGYENAVRPLREYWNEIAQPRATAAVRAAGLGRSPIRIWERPAELLAGLEDLSPLQKYAATAALLESPQLFILEDVTGAGKTEAALLLAHRMMVAGLGHGMYFALPTMATANQMYGRVATIYRRMFDPDGRPSLVLAHTARDMVDLFRQSIVRAEAPQVIRTSTIRGDDSSAECGAWIADHRKKALLADVGVGTIDQALLAVMPVRHQSLRMLGLQGKILIVDEVHAYDPYMMRLLRALLSYHASHGGSAILLSATIPLSTRAELVAGFQGGLGATVTDESQNRQYPLATQVSSEVTTHPCATMPQLERRIRVVAMHDEAEVARFVAEQAAVGRCVGWIRNTVEDARRAWQEVAALRPEGMVMLFHSRYALGDRLDIEREVVERFGKGSSAETRAGRVLIGTQVLEQSLDYDMDVVVTDLAPIDLMVQRAGRLMRHLRDVDGNPSEDGRDHRGDPVLYLLTPPPQDEPEKNWYAEMFPKACYVYPDAGRLWLGARALLRAGAIITPGTDADAGGVRTLVESVYGEATEEIPEELQKATLNQEACALAMTSQGAFNSLRSDTGYSIESSARWDEDDRVPTRLGDETLPIYLAVVAGDELLPLRSDSRRPWEASSVRADARRFKGLGREWSKRFGGAVDVLRAGIPLLREPAFIIPMVPAPDGCLQGLVTDGRDEKTVRYDRVQGLVW